MTGAAGAAGSSETLHATSVAIGPAGVLIIGKSGSGKSGLALQLIGLGAKLISDDLTRVSLSDNVPVAHAPDRLAGVIEARNVGLIHVPHQAKAVLQLVVDLGRDEDERLPPRRMTRILGCELDLLRRVDAPYFAGAIFHHVSRGRYA